MGAKGPQGNYFIFKRAEFFVFLISAAQTTIIHFDNFRNNFRK
jgi:hypothetical protein